MVIIAALATVGAGEWSSCITTGWRARRATGPVKARLDLHRLHAVHGAVESVHSRAANAGRAKMPPAIDARPDPHASSQLPKKGKITPTA